MEVFALKLDGLRVNEFCLVRSPGISKIQKPSFSEVPHLS